SRSTLGLLDDSIRLSKTIMPGGSKYIFDGVWGNIMRKLILAAAMVVLGASNGYAAKMGVAFNWGPTTACFDEKSPPITLSNVPAGTASLQIRMIDQNASS